ncbi:MAG: winged helix-turn-helix domain-containing protein [Candidatus Bathyarchaeota archaeon]|nr:winged helix-turn-helix domain-containing protein [Candidatus Bathyarchaeota archaeon]
MRLKLVLFKDDRVLLELPLSAEAWPRQQLFDELTSLEEDSARFVKLFDALSNRTRLRMVRRLLEEDNHTLGFTDFMRELGLNPKIVWQNTKKLCAGGLLEKDGDGKYSFPEIGRVEFLLISLVLKHLRKALSDVELGEETW